MLCLKIFKQCINVCFVSIVMLNISKVTYVKQKKTICARFIVAETFPLTQKIKHFVKIQFCMLHIIF